MAQEDAAVTPLLVVPKPHPADRMAVIKAEVAKLETEYAELRDQIISGDVSPIGTEWVATVMEMEARHIDVASAERTLAPAVFDALVRVSPMVRVTLHRLRSKPKSRKPWGGWTGQLRKRRKTR